MRRLHQAEVWAIAGTTAWRRSHPRRCCSASSTYPFAMEQLDAGVVGEIEPGNRLHASGGRIGARRRRRRGCAKGNSQADSDDGRGTAKQ